MGTERRLPSLFVLALIVAVALSGALATGARAAPSGPRLAMGDSFSLLIELKDEQALVAVVQEAYVNGVSTRKV